MKTIVAVMASGAHRAVSIKDTDCQRDALTAICEGESSSDPIVHFMVLSIQDGDAHVETYSRITKEAARVLHTIQELVEYVLGGTPTDDAPVDERKDQNAPSTRRVQ